MNKLYVPVSAGAHAGPQGRSVSLRGSRIWSTSAGSDNAPACHVCQHLPALRAARMRGFTLLEMLAVIVLIGIIGSVVVTQVGKNVDKGKYGAGKAQLMTLSQKAENYALDNGTPPPKLEDLVTKPADAPNWQGPYAKQSDLLDPWRHAFGYQYPGQNGSFDLIFYGQDGKPGGDGYSKDVGNWQ